MSVRLSPFEIPQKNINTRILMKIALTSGQGVVKGKKRLHFGIDPDDIPDITENIPPPNKLWDIWVNTGPPGRGGLCPRSAFWLSLRHSREDKFKLRLMYARS